MADCDLNNPGRAESHRVGRRYLRGAERPELRPSDDVQQHHRSRGARRPGRALRRLADLARRCSRRCCRACRSRSATSAAGSRTSPPTTTSPRHRGHSTASASPRRRDPRLPDGGGYVVSNLYNVDADASSARPNNYVTFAGNFGEQYQRYNGIHDQRQRAAAQRADGAGRGQQRQDGHGQLRDPGSCCRRSRLTNPYCHNDPGLVTTMSGLAAYTIPRIDVLGERHVPQRSGPGAGGQLRGARGQVAQSLGRPPSGNVANVSINLARARRRSAIASTRSTCGSPRSCASAGRARTSVSISTTCSTRARS